MSCVATQRTPCSRPPQTTRSQNGCDYAQSLLERMYDVLAITHLYRLVEAEGGKHNSVKDDEQEEGKIKKGEETKDGGNVVNNPNLVQRYQLSNNIESATLELDETASIISYEEYYPYGDTSYQAGRDASEVSQKRYRYTGKEKDEESGLYYMLARYYSGWLGRWTAADPAGLVDGPNLYAYCRGNPVGLMDPDGMTADGAGNLDEQTERKGERYYILLNLRSVTGAKESIKKIKELSKELGSLVGTENVKLIFEPASKDFINAYNDEETAVIFNYGHGAEDNAAMIFYDPKDILYAENINTGKDNQIIIKYPYIHSINYVCNQKKPEYEREWSYNLKNAVFYYDEVVETKVALPALIEDLEAAIKVVKYEKSK